MQMHAFAVYSTDDILEENQPINNVTEKEKMPSDLRVSC